MLWMKHRDKLGVWHLVHRKELTPGRQVKVTACRGDQLFGSIGPVIQEFQSIPLSPSCVRCAKIFNESCKASPTQIRDTEDKSTQVPSPL